jgi:putative tricarboxylic transport membrane protein
MALGATAVLEAVQLPFGTLRAPQSGFWPSILGILLLLFSLIHFGKAIEKRVERENSFWSQSGAWKRIGLVAGSLIAFALVFEPLGYLLAVFLLMSFLLRIIKPMKWWLVVVVGLLSSVLSYLIFGVLLSTPLPSGILGMF